MSILNHVSSCTQQPASFHLWSAVEFCHFNFKMFPCTTRNAPNNLNTLVRLRRCDYRCHTASLTNTGAEWVRKVMGDSGYGMGRHSNVSKTKAMQICMWYG